MEEIEKIMEEIRIRLKGYRVERTTVQDVPEPVMLIANPKTGYAYGYLLSNIQELLSQGLTPKEIAKRFCDGILETEQAHIYLESQMESFEKVKDKLFFGWQVRSRKEKYCNMSYILRFWIWKLYFMWSFQILNITNIVPVH